MLHSDIVNKLKKEEAYKILAFAMLAVESKTFRHLNKADWR